MRRLFPLLIAAAALSAGPSHARMGFDPDDHMDHLDDCHPAQSRVTGSDWEVLIDTVSFGATAPNAWVAVLPQHVLHRRDGKKAGVACWWQGRVQYFVPPAGP